MAGNARTMDSLTVGALALPDNQGVRLFMTAMTRFLVWVPLALVAFLPGQSVSPDAVTQPATRVFIGPADSRVFAARQAAAPAAEAAEVTVRDGMTIVTVPQSRHSWLQARRNADGEIRIGHGVGHGH